MLGDAAALLLLSKCDRCAACPEPPAQPSTSPRCRPLSSPRLELTGALRSQGIQAVMKHERAIRRSERPDAPQRPDAFAAFSAAFSAFLLSCSSFISSSIRLSASI